MDPLLSEIEGLFLKIPKLISTHEVILDYEAIVNEILLCQVVEYIVYIVVSGHDSNLYMFKYGLITQSVTYSKLEYNPSFVHFRHIHEGNPYALHSNSVDIYKFNSASYRSDKENDLDKIIHIFSLSGELHYIVEGNSDTIHIAVLKTKTTYKKVSVSLKDAKFLFFGNYLVCYNFCEYVKVNLVDDVQTKGKYEFTSDVHYRTKYNRYHNNNVVTFVDTNGNVCAYDFEKDINVKLAKIPEHEKDITYTFKENNMYYSVYFHDRKRIKIIINSTTIDIKESSERKLIKIKDIEFDLNVLQQRTEYFKEVPSDPARPFIYGYYNNTKEKLDHYNEYQLSCYRFYTVSGVIFRDFIFPLFSMCMHIGDINSNFISVKLICELEKEDKGELTKAIFKEPIKLMHIYINLYIFYETLLPRYVKILFKNVNIDDLLPHMKSYTQRMLYCIEHSEFSKNEKFQSLYKSAHKDL